jgi:hypothetical protein
MKSVKSAGVLLTACSVNEFLWQIFPSDMAGDIKSITQFPLIVVLCFFVAVLSRSVLTSAVCIAISGMSSTTAICSVWYLYSPWVYIQGTETCSAKTGPVVMLLSALAAMLVLIVWRNHVQSDD